MKKTVNSDTALQDLIGDLRETYKVHRFIKVTYTTGKARSQDQNEISHVWYEQISRELREDTALGVKQFCKLHYGVPILRAESEEFRTLYDLVIKPLSYEKKLAGMSAWPVTSLMTKDQLSQYLEAMQQGYAGRVRLEFPETDERRAA
jgi:hypothetical protein